MWTALLALVTKIIGVFWPDKTAEKTARDDGVASGIAQQKASDQSVTIKGQDHVIESQQSMANVPPVRDDDAVNRLRDWTA